MPWTKIRFTQEDIEAGKPKEVVAAIAAVYMFHPVPEVVLYQTSGVSGVNEYYITPEASFLTKQPLSVIGARECPDPDITSLLPILLPLKKRNRL